MSGFQVYQLSSDGDVNGKFTGTVLTLWNCGHYKGRYSEFHHDVLDEMPSDQTPNLLSLEHSDKESEAMPVFTVYAGQKDPWDK